MAVTSEDLKEYLRLPQDNITVVGKATIDRAAFTAAVKRSGLYVFTKIETGWLLDGSPVSLNDYGITPDESETEITVDYFTINVDNYLAAAKSKAISAGVPVFENNAQYDLFITALAAMYYENRAMAFEGQDKGERAAKNIINSFVNELRYAKEDES